jgi:hypothetical protein
VHATGEGENAIIEGSNEYAKQAAEYISFAACIIDDIHNPD